MSAPDARLNAAERAALADLEAAAVADDPHLAARLRGAPGSRLKTVVPLIQRFRPVALRTWSSFLDLGWWGVPITLVGLGLVVLGMSAGLALSVFGAVVTLAGLRLLAELVERRRHRSGTDSAG